MLFVCFFYIYIYLLFSLLLSYLSYIYHIYLYIIEPSVNYGWASIFQLSSDGEHWELEQEIASPVGNNSYFGAGVGIYEDSIIVGADGYRKWILLLLLLLYYIGLCRSCSSVYYYYRYLFYYLFIFYSLSLLQHVLD